MSPHSIVGHARQLAELKADIDSGNVAHAYLFGGAPNLGKMTVAKWFAREMMIVGKTPEQIQEIDHQLEHLIHPDYMVLDQLWIEDQCEDWNLIAKSTNVPLQHRAKAPPARTDIISIDDVREIQTRLQEAGNGQYRFCVIRGIERMQEGAANAFLKILEEPPPGRIFILTTDTLQTVLPTILSRSRVVRFQRVADRDVSTLLKDSNEDDQRFILHLAQGAPGRAVRLAEDADALADEKELHQQAMGFWKTSSPINRMMALVPLHKKGANADRFLFHLALALRETGDYTRHQEQALVELSEGLRTNASRALMTEYFALSSQK
jgi:DNA polymerase-3 subunit delta'